jgi:hypothetical protein
MRLIASRTKFAHSLVLSLQRLTPDIWAISQFTGLEGLAHDIGHGDPNDDLRDAR